MKGARFLWSVRRELWENRSLYIAPAVVAAFALCGSCIGAARLPSRLRAAALRGPLALHEAVITHFAMAAFMSLATACVVGVFYCLDALHGERRDRSILFWKSLPVSDSMAVAAKASVPLVVLPALTFGLIVTVQAGIALVSSAVLQASGLGAAVLWREAHFAASSVTVLYSVIVITLWHAPLYAWLLLVSAWARRTVFLWAFVPPLAAAAIERMAFNSHHIGDWLRNRVIGWYVDAFSPDPMAAAINPLSSITPGRLLLSPCLWSGLIAAAVFLAGAVWLRRRRGPI